MNPVDALASAVRSWASNRSDVRALLWFGSHARRNAGFSSDLDCALILRESVSPIDVLNGMRSCLGGLQETELAWSEDRKATLWVGTELMKLDLVFAYRPDELRWIADADDVAPPRLRVAFDPEGICQDLIRRAEGDLHPDLRTLVNREVDKFLVGFEACSAAHRRSDGYQHYFHYNLAIQRLGRLIQLARGGASHLFLLRNLLSGRLSLEEQLRFRQLAGTLYLPEANERKRRLAGYFLEVYKEISGQFSPQRSYSDVRDFLEAILERDLFFNVRDFGRHYGGRVRSGVVFRGPCLARWQTEEYLMRWLTKHGISTIIDFRHPVERNKENADYSEAFLSKVTYFNLPLSGEPANNTQAPGPEETAASYREITSTHARNIVDALRVIAQSARACFVHCHVGRDRTGVFCALLASLLGMPRDRVIEDYLASEMSVRAQSIELYLDWVDQQGGASKLLGERGLSPAEAVALQKRLLCVDAQVGESVRDAQARTSVPMPSA